MADVNPELEAFAAKHRAAFAQAVRRMPGRASWSTARLERSGEIEKAQRQYIRNCLR